MADGVSEAPTAAPRAVEPRAESRVVFELQEELAHAQAQLAERLAADRIRELEFAAARRELDVQAAYTSMLERLAADRLDQLTQLHQYMAHVEREIEVPAVVTRAEAALAARLDHALTVGAEQHRQLHEQLAGLETQIVSGIAGRFDAQLDAGLARFDETGEMQQLRAAAASAEQRAAAIAVALAAQQSRASSRLVERAIAFLRRSPRLLSAAYRLTNLLAGRRDR